MLHAFTLLLPLFLSAGDDAALEANAAKVRDFAMKDSQAWNILETLCDGVGNRISGSPQAEQAVEWGVKKFQELGFDHVRRQPVTVHWWVRGAREEVSIVAPYPHDVVALALGGSIATPAEGITAPVVIVNDIDDLKKHPIDAKGKIVLFNKRMGPDASGKPLGYGDVVPQRVNGAIEAAKCGAVASLIRSVGSADYRLPHTGMMRYQDGVPKIPHAAITAEDADTIERLIARGETVTVRMKLSCSDGGMVPSANVVAELPGREKPDEVVVIGGHLDSWDVGQGAQDDGTGIAASIEALRVLKASGMIPRRTVRVVLFMNEENGGAGGDGYAKEMASTLDRHVAAVEMDGGSFDPEGFGITAGAGGLAQLAVVGRVLAPLGCGALTEKGGGADIGPMSKSGVPMIGLKNDSTKYFRYHHTPADTLDKVDPQELAKCSAMMAVMAYTLAEMDAPLPRLPPGTAETH